MVTLRSTDGLLGRVTTSAGRAVIRTNRGLARIEEILAMRAVGATDQEIVGAFPGLEPKDVRLAELHDRLLLYSASHPRQLATAR